MIKIYLITILENIVDVSYGNNIPNTLPFIKYGQRNCIIVLLKVKFSISSLLGQIKDLALKPDAG